MNRTIVAVAVVFAAGALGGLANSLLVWFSGAVGLSGALGVAIAPALTPGWLYPRLVWGGLWGGLFLLPWPATPWWFRSLLFSLGPSAVQLLVVFPVQTPHGIFDLGLGALTPLLALMFNATWGLVAAWAIRAARINH